jgi:hypothetical protein
LRFVRLIPIALVSLMSAGARAQNSPSETAFVYFGEPDPTGVDQSFLALGRRRGAQIARETPGQLGGGAPSAELMRALTAYGELRFAEAIQILDALEREVVPRGGGGLSQGELVDLHAYRAAARMASGDEAGAWDDLIAVAVLGASRPLDPARFSPRLVEAARRAAQTIGPSARLVVTATPDDALLIVDGQLLGRGRVEAALPPGAHLVRAERAGFRASGRLIELAAAGAEARLALDPAPAPTVAQLAARAAQLGVRRAIAAFVIADQGRAAVELALVDVRAARVEGRARLADDERLTTADLVAAVDGLWGAAAAEEPRPRARPPAPWYRRPVVWGVVAGVAAASALAVGLGVGLSGGHEPGFAARVDLGPAR